jgi:hypothetical protein
MAIDPSIALGVKPVQIESPINQMAKMYEMQNAVQSNELNRMKMDEYSRGVAKTEKFNNALAQAKDEADIKNAFISVGDIKGYQDYLKSVTEEKNLGFTGQKTQVEAADKKQSMMQSMMRDLSTRPSDANLMAHAEDIEASPLFSPQEKAAVKRRMQVLLSLPMDQRVPELASQGASAGELKPTIQTQNLNDRSVVSSYPAFGGAPKQLSSTPMGVSPADVQRIALDKQRVKLESQRVSEGNRRDVVASTLTDAAGNVTQYNKFGELIGTKPNAGKPSATFEKTKAAKQQLGLDLDLAIKELTEATKEGGLIETATGSGAGALRDIGAGFFGETTAGAEALGALQPIYDKVLKMVPRFEGPQSDKDTISYNKAAGDLGNPNAPTGKKLAAAKTILRLMKDRKAEFLTRDMAEGGAVPNAGGDVDASNPLLN